MHESEKFRVEDTVLTLSSPN